MCSEEKQYHLYYFLIGSPRAFDAGKKTSSKVLLGHGKLRANLKQAFSSAFLFLK